MGGKPGCEAGLPGKESGILFTLIELLVVVAIVGILASLLLPALRSTMNAAHNAECTSNLKQIGIAFSAYLDDHRGCFPSPAIAWRTYDEVGRYLSESAKHQIGYAGQTYPDYVFMPCPVGKAASDDWTYAFNACASNTYISGWGRLGKWRNPSQKIMVIDGFYIPQFWGAAQYFDPASSNCRVRYRHNGCSNILFMGSAVRGMGQRFILDNFGDLSSADQ